MWKSILLVMLICVGVYASPAHTTIKRKLLTNEVAEFKSASVADTKVSAREESPYRLPNTTKPIHYNIWWKINISPPTFTFSGTVDIDLQATQSNVSKIVINTRNLTIDSLTLKLGEIIINQTYSFDLNQEFLIISLTSGTLGYNADKPISYRLSIAFNADLRTDMSGLYRSWYINFGKIHWMASSQFSTTAARSAFPCYDEPAFKATFDVTVTRQQNFKSWSNMRRKENRVSVFNGYEDDIYNTSPIMSTYLIAIVVAEYDSEVKVETANGTNDVVYEVIGRPDVIKTGQQTFSFDVGQRALNKLINYTGIDYYSFQKSMKLTHAAIPDFDKGAMENWGLITYREAVLMYNENNSNTFEKQITATTVTHETSHSWFGDLVTLDWWDVTWLNEGFATFFQYFITDEITDMKYATRFITEQVQVALLADSFDSPQPLTNTGVGSRSSIDDMFSTISYSKGAAVIRMTDQLMGSENHKLGLRKYLTARAFQTARPIHLFQNLQESALESGAIAQYGSDFNMIDYYKTWTEQGGHPILSVNVDRLTGVVNIRQRQFNINSGYSTPKMNWIIPITFATAKNPDFSDTKPTHIIKDENVTLPLALGNDDWIIFNKQQSGFYRVNYDNHTWDLIINLLRGPNRELIHEHNRAQIVDDVFQFARSGIMTYNRAFNILSFLKNETAYAPWQAARTGFNWITTRLRGSSLEQPVKNLFVKWASELMKNLTYIPIEGEPFLRTNLRLYLGGLLCRYGASECIATARKLVADLYNWGIEVPVNIGPWVYCNGLREGNPNYYNFLYNRYFYHPVNTEQVRIIGLLGCTTDESSLLRYLDAIFKENFVVRPQELSNAYESAVGDNVANTQITFRYIQQNLNAVRAKFGSITSPLYEVASRLLSKDEVKQFQDWATENKAALGDSFQEVFDSVNDTLDRLKWAESVHDDINSYLTEGDKPVEATATKVA
ncbi:hypothetical protein ACJJTC_018177 [Scirpophaga incertulas]